MDDESSRAVFAVDPLATELARGHAMRRGARLRRARERAGLTQQSLARGIVSAAYISRIERGQRWPTPTVLRLLADRLGVAVDEFVNEHEEGTLRRLGVAQATALTLLGQPSAAHEVLEVLNRQRPASSDSTYFESVLEVARAQLELRNLVEARALLEWLDRHEELPLDIVDVRAQLCRCYLQLGLLSAAIAAGEHAENAIVELGVSTLPSSTSARYWQYHALLASGNEEAARDVASRAVQATPALPIVNISAATSHVRAAAAHARRGNPGLAAKLTEQAAHMIDIVTQAAQLTELRSASTTASAPSGQNL